ncbi:MAG: type II secretion system F family protein [Pseudomonadota bacterium]|nr:type II secretion system F family protein [Pseudomonadota bacterium]
MNVFRRYNQFSTTQWYLALNRLEQLITGGLPLALALGVVAKQTHQPALKRHYQYLQHSVQAGISLAEALSIEKRRALKAAQAGIAVAEQTGQLPLVMQSLVASWKRQRHISALVKNALRYPVALLFMALIIITVFVTWVLPTIQQLFDSQPLPALTQYLITCVTWLRQSATNILAITGILLLSFTVLYRLQKQRVQAVMQRLPIWGKLKRLSVYQSTFEYLALGMQSGMSAVNATQMVASHSTWLPMQSKLLKIAQALNQGNSWSRSFSTVQINDPTIQAYLQTAEHIGRVDHAVERLSQDFSQRIERYCEQLRVWLNPLLMIILTGIIGFMLLAMYLPIFSLTQQLA